MTKTLRPLGANGEASRAQTVDTWTPDCGRIVEHIAGVEDYPLNLTACARVIEDSRRLL
jgi:hypothetical protein